MSGGSSERIKSQGQSSAVEGHYRKGFSTGNASGRATASWGQSEKLRSRACFAPKRLPVRRRLSGLWEGRHGVNGNPAKVPPSSMSSLWYDVVAGTHHQHGDR